MTDPKKLCYCIHCKDCYEDFGSELCVHFSSWSNLENKEFGICYECIKCYKGARN